MKGVENEMTACDELVISESKKDAALGLTETVSSRVSASAVEWMQFVLLLHSTAAVCSKLSVTNDAVAQATCISLWVIAGTAMMKMDE